MSEQKGLGSKFLGLFVEVEGEPRAEERESEALSGEKSAADLVAELANQTAPGGKRPGAPTPPAARSAAPTPSARAAAPAEELPALKVDKLPAPPAAGAAVDFEAIFKSVGMDAAELDRVKKAEELLKSLPDATPVAIKKQIVEASLKAFGFEIEKIIAAAQNQNRAIDTYVRVNESSTAKAIQDAETQIRTLNEKIASLQADIEKRTAGLASLSTSAQERKAQVQKVIEFFQGPAGPTTPGTP